jgi:type IV pilus assembly protein PilC
MVVEMSAVGETSGNLADQLATASGILQTDFDRTVSRLVSSIEPALIIMVGLVVGLVGVTIITTVYSALPAIGG